MKQIFLIGVGGSALLATLGYFLWCVLRSFHDMYEDYQLGKELAVLRKEASARQQERRAREQARLANGCQHHFDNCFGALPDEVCCRCGIARTKPSGSCDHQWKIVPGPVPGSQCTLCGRVHSSTGALRPDYPVSKI